MHFSILIVFVGISLHNARIALAQSCGAGCSLHSLAFSDEFNGTAVDESSWNYRTDRKGLSAQLESNVNVTDGYMNIALKKQTVGEYSYTGGGLVSKNNFHYGFYEARMKLNHGAGWHSAFWQMAGNGTTTFNQASPNWTEFDTFEVDSSKTPPSAIRHNIITWRYKNNDHQTSRVQTSGVYTASVDYAADYHIFGTLWNETSVSFYIDGVSVKSFNYPATSNPHDYLNIWLTCIGLTNPIDNSLLPNYVSTDYVRFYQRDYYLTATSLCRGKYQGSTSCPSNQGYRETGSWAQSSLDGYTLALKSRYSCVPKTTASWSQSVPVAGSYQVSAWIVAGPGSDPAAMYSVTHNGIMLNTSAVDQSSGIGRWVMLRDSVSVEANDVIQVTLNASGRGCARSDAVKLVRVL